MLIASAITCIMTQTSKRDQHRMSDVTSGFPLDFFRALAEPNRIALIA